MRNHAKGAKGKAVGRPPGANGAARTGEVRRICLSPNDSTLMGVISRVPRLSVAPRKRPQFSLLEIGFALGLRCC